MPRLLGRAKGNVEARLPCPVCLGVKMQKVHLANDAQKTGSLTLDHCARCGGVWFERGEVQRLARHRRDALHLEIGRRIAPPMPPCHKCRTPLARDAERCHACGRHNLLQCPACQLPMRREQRGDLALDACERCHGIWFDHVELEHVWNVSVSRAAARWRAQHGERGARVLDGAGGALLEGLIWAPDLVFHGAYAAGHVAVAGAELAGHAIAGAGEAIASGAASEAAVAAAEIAGDAASGVFDVIAEMIGGILEGLFD